MTALVVDAQPLKAAVVERLITECPDILGFPNGEAVDVPYLPDSDQRVVPYWVLAPSTTTPGDEHDLGDTMVDGDWFLQITVAAGMTDDLLAATAKIQAALYRWAPTVDGVVCGPLRPPIGFQPRTLWDRQETPKRPYIALQYVSQNTIT